MMRLAQNIVALVVFAALVYAFRVPLFVFSHQALQSVAPCTVPIRYALGTIDPRFSISTSSVEAIANDAVSVWEKAAGRDLFVYVRDAIPIIVVNLYYDSRQETTETLKGLGAEISSTVETYDALEAKYLAARVSYQREKAAFQSESIGFDRDASAYEREVDSWNARGGAPQNVVTRLTNEKNQLQARRQKLMVDQDRLNSMADQVNALAQELNTMARDLNISARAYNTVGAQNGEEFEEGAYERRAGHEEINVYEFDSRARLTRLLAHEFGHALGLVHIENSASIMYRLNHSANGEPTAEDTTELARACPL